MTTIRKTLLALTMAALPAAAAAQSAAHDQAAALIGPMLQEMAPGRGGEVFTACIIAAATPEELAALVAAPAPSQAVGQLINTILARPEVLACVQQAAAG